MASFQHTLAQLLMVHPLIYPEPLDGTLHLFNSPPDHYRWQRGELVRNFADDKLAAGGKMDYSDLDQTAQALGHEGRKGHGKLEIGLHLARQQRQLVEQNINAISQADPTATYFRRSFDFPPSILELLQGKTVAQPGFLSFPDDIAPDWARALTRVHDWMLHAMRMHLGWDGQGNTAHWPESAKHLHEKILVAKERLHPLMHDGQSYADFTEANRAFAQRIIGQLRAEEDHVEVAGPTARRRGP